MCARRYPKVNTFDASRLVYTHPYAQTHTHIHRMPCRAVNACSRAYPRVHSTRAFVLPPTFFFLVLLLFLLLAPKSLLPYSQILAAKLAVKERRLSERCALKGGSPAPPGTGTQRSRFVKAKGPVSAQRVREYAHRSTRTHTQICTHAMVPSHVRVVHRNVGSTLSFRQ